MTAMALGMLEMQISTYNQGLQSERTFSGEVIPDAQATLDVVRIGYSGNENNFSDLIGAELTLLDARNELAGIVMNRRIALAEIERIVGKTIGEGQ
jgi:outer membrane protein TolC